jgi:ferric iron reductase protein FhuF
MRLSADEIKQLEKFRLSNNRTHSPLSIRMDRLFDENELIAYLQSVQQKIGARNQAVAVSMLLKRYSFLVAMVLYAMSVWNKHLLLSFDQIWMETDDELETWLPTFRFESLECTVADENRGKWREKTIQLLFAEHIALFIEQLRKIANISPLILWENIAIYIVWLYETLLEENKSVHIHNRIYDDFLFVIQEADGRLFGPYSQNPLRRFWKGEKGERRRTTCCLYYQTAAQSHCRTCPVRCESS